MTPEIDLIDSYLDELLSRLRGPARAVRSTLNEAESHLRDAVDDKVAAGADLGDARRDAIAQFGTAREIAAAANRGVSAVGAGHLARALLGAGARMAAVGLSAIAITAVACRVLAAVTSTSFVFGVPSGTTLPQADCSHWLHVQSSATTCTQAATLENANDSFLLYLGGAIAGLLILAVVAVSVQAVRKAGHATRPSVRIPAGVVPAIGATVFGGAGLALLAAGVSDLVLPGLWGQGLWYVEAAIALAIAIAYAVGFTRTLISDTGPSVATS